MTEACFFLMTDSKLFGMNLAGLMKLGREGAMAVFDWESIPPPPFDFCVDLPETDTRDRVAFHQYHFVFDSKVYVARGGLVSAYDIEEFVGHVKKKAKAKASSSEKKKKISDYSMDDIRECIADMPCCKIYQFDHDMLQLHNNHSIPPLPTPFAPCFLGNITPCSSSGDGDVYCLVYHKSKTPQFEGLWVLRSSSSSSGDWDWEPLPPPPPFHNEDFRGDYHCCFVSQDKLFLQVCSYQRKHALYSFDLRAAEWTPVHDHIMHSFDVMCSFNRRMTTLGFPSVTMSLPGLTDYRSVGLHCSCILDRTGDDDELEVMICALMLNNQNGAVSLYQLLEECFEGMQTADFDIGGIRIGLADLGNGMVCALLYGYTPDHDGPVLCISVFTLTVAAPEEHSFVDIGTATEEEAPPQKKQTKFLNVQVHVKRLFNMNDYEHSRVLHPFVFRPHKEEEGVAIIKHACFKGKNANKVNKVSFSNRERKELLFVNLPKKRIWWEAWKRSVKRRLSTKSREAVAKEAGNDLSRK